MKTERWRQVEELYHSALGRGPEERAAFLAGACGGDEGLRREVEELLAARERAGDFMERPALEVEARSLAGGRAAPRAALGAGQSFARYEVVRLLGRGGMGEVYLARDASLGRPVALKLLPADAAEDPERLRRFEREARAASALNHPNIVTVYEVGRADAAHYIATEFVEGHTLRELLAGGPLGVGEAVEVATQVASALAAAHAAGVVHRDVKPENIIASRGGHLTQKEIHVKVLDFGIAKLTGRGTAGAEATTQALVQTAEGAVIGTAPYMSPEQAKGLEVDWRTDIWSLGVVLYEVVTGRLPFEGPTRSHTLISIMEKEPPPLRASAGEVPEQLEWVVTKALRKDREERYQTAKELFSDLKDLKLRLDEQARRERSADPQTPGAGTRDAGPTTSAAARPAAGTDESAAARTTAAAARPPWRGVPRGRPSWRSPCSSSPRRAYTSGSDTGARPRTRRPPPSASMG